MSNARTSQRPSASTALWAHLLRKDVSSLLPASNPNPHAPTAPIDKAGTSMRLLLHDTQANLEKFSERVDKLTGEVEETRREVVLVKMLWEGEREKTQASFVDLVNRCQTSIQKSIGTPAQALALDTLRKEVSFSEHRQDALEKRIDALQLLTQTQTHSIQTQTQALQKIQDQLASIIPAILPLLPIVQAMPLHIDAAQSKILGSLEGATGRVLDSVGGVSSFAEGVLDGVRQESAYIREVSLSVQMFLKERKESANFEKPCIANIPNPISKPVNYTLSTTDPLHVPNVKLASAQVLGLSPPIPQKPQLLKRPGSPMSAPSRKKITSWPAEESDNQMARRVNRSPLPTTPLIRSPNAKPDSATDTNALPFDTKRPLSPRIPSAHASFSAAASDSASAQFSNTAPMSASIAPDKRGGSTLRCVSTFSVSPSMSSELPTTILTPTIDSMPAKHPPVQPVHRPIRSSSPSSHKPVFPLPQLNKDISGEPPADFLLVSLPLTNKQPEHVRKLNAKRFIPLDDDSSDDTEVG